MCYLKKAAHFFLAFKANSATRVTIHAAMKAKGYLDVEAANRVLVQQVQYKAPKTKG